MSESVAADPKLALLRDVGQNPQPASKVEARNFRPAGAGARTGTRSNVRRDRCKRSELPDVQQGRNTHTNLASAGLPFNTPRAACSRHGW